MAEVVGHEKELRRSLGFPSFHEPMRLVGDVEPAFAYGKAEGEDTVCVCGRRPSSIRLRAQQLAANRCQLERSRPIAGLILLLPGRGSKGGILEKYQ